MKNILLINILLISGHTNLAASVANKTIIETVQKLLPEVEVVKLDELYPDYKINVPVEQQRLVKADIIVLEFPIFWYSAPSILERWMEETFQHGFSHGSTGDKLKGKKLVLSFTTGALATIAQWVIPLRSCCLALRLPASSAKWSLPDTSTQVASATATVPRLNLLHSRTKPLLNMQSVS